MQLLFDRPLCVTRRGFLLSAAALAAQNRSSILAYVGTYSSPQGPEGSRGRGQGIYLFEMNPATGALKQREVIANDANPAWLAFNPARTHLYSANETTTFQGASAGSVSSYAIDRASGHLTLVNTVSSEAAGPAHLSVHPAGKHVLIADYFGGTVAVLPIGAKGELGAPTDVKHDRGALGSEHAVSAPPGSFAISGHDKPHAHMIQADPAGRFVIHADLALDQLLIWKFDVEKGTLTPADPPFEAVDTGDGPRHFAFHPNGRWFYSLQEEGSALAMYDYDAAHGKLSKRAGISTLPQGFAGTNYTSEVMISADGKFVYAANRLHDSIAFFSLDAAGVPELVGEEWTRGDYPRSFNIDPSGNFLYTCNQRADAVVAFRMNRKTGGLKFTGQYTPVGTPGIIIFLT